jgi:hypothetical protein
MQHVVFSINHQKVAAHGRSEIVGFDYKSQKKSDFPTSLTKSIRSLEEMV